jgi:hypothetical protein
MAMIGLVLAFQGELRGEQPEMIKRGEVTQLLTDLGRPRTVRYEKAKYMLILAPDRSRWEESLLDIVHGVTNEVSGEQATQALYVLSQYRDEKLLSVYRDRLYALVKCEQRKQNVSANIYALLEAIGYVGTEKDAPLVESTLRFLLKGSGGESCLVDDESFWPITLACIFLGEYGKAETGAFLSQIRKRICDEIASEAHQQGRSKGMASENLGTVLFSVDYAISRLSGISSFRTLTDILDASEEYRVRVAAMNLLASNIDYAKSGLERNQSIFPCRSEWEMNEILKVHQRTLESMGKVPQNVLYGQVVLADGTHPKAAMSSDAIEKEMLAMRHQLNVSYEMWENLKKRLVPASQSDVLDLIRNGPTAGHSWKHELTRDKRREMPFTEGYL